MFFVRTRTPLKNYRGHNVLTAVDCLGKDHHKSETEVLLILDAHHLYSPFAQNQEGSSHARTACTRSVYLRKAVRPLRSVNPRETPTAHSNIKSPRDPLFLIRTERGSSASRFSVHGGVHRADPHLGQRTLTLTNTQR
jgi:hypothetical protein